MPWLSVQSPVGTQNDEIEFHASLIKQWSNAWLSDSQNFSDQSNKKHTPTTHGIITFKTKKRARVIPMQREIE